MTQIITLTSLDQDIIRTISDIEILDKLLTSKTDWITEFFFNPVELPKELHSQQLTRKN